MFRCCVSNDKKQLLCTGTNVYSHRRLFCFFPADNKYQRQFDSNQTEADHLITSEEVIKENSESRINVSKARTHQNINLSI